jgi:hypothetical protein
VGDGLELGVTVAVVWVGGSVAEGTDTGSPVHAAASTTNAVAHIARRISGSLSVSA